jgi:hypothetical protein
MLCLYNSTEARKPREATSVTQVITEEESDIPSGSHITTARRLRGIKPRSHFPLAVSREST